MKFSSYVISSIILIIICLSCSDESIRLFHPPQEEPEPEPEIPEYYWLLKTVTYPEDNPGFSFRYSQEFTYTDNDLMKTIQSSNIKDSAIVIDYISDRKISYSRLIKQSESTIYYDSLLVFRNDKKQAEYALHVRYTERTSNGKVSKQVAINDSTTFIYDDAGYIKQLDHYDKTGVTSSLNYTENYTIKDGNISGITTSKGYRFVYTYDDKEYAAPSDYCYEMPRNTFNMASTCWLMASLPFLSEHMGTKNKNNIIQAEIIQMEGERKYADIKYNYTFDENNFVSQIVMSGTTKYNKTFENYITSFSYIKKEKKKQ